MDVMTITSVRDTDDAHDVLVDRARGLQTLLREQVSSGETLRRLPDAVAEALLREGMYRLLTPKRFDGHAVDAVTVLRVSETLAEADGSAAWSVIINAIGSWLAGQFAPQCQHEIFGANPDARFAGSTTPGSARREHRGLRISGRWPYCSGAQHADWTVFGVTAETGGASERLLCCVPASELKVEKTWRTIGMRGTGSDTLVAHDLYVPEYRTLAFERLGHCAPSSQLETMHRMPFTALGTLTMLGPLLGMAKGALDFVAARASSQPLSNTLYPRQSDSAGLQIQLAQAALMIRTARMHAYEMAAALDTAAARDLAVDYPGRSEIRARIGYAAQQVVDALTILVSVHGAGSFAESTVLQQYWRDANTLARHAGLQPTVGYEIYGKTLVGVDERISPTI